ncbi:MAG TPA: hypothetical protein DD806_07580 [Flavobacterium sp.]|nr:hypothetical protein [Flavobacterium sp.]
MNRILNVFSFIVLHISLIGFAQNDKFKGETFLFQDAKTKDAIVIEHDSVYYKNTPIQFQKLKHTEYPEIISRYISHTINGKNYFTHSGCGPVLEWRNDSLVRIDNSFLHQNQFGASTFVYKNEIFYFGGYGLFTFKNILTKYIYKSKEWMAIQTFGSEFPSLRRDANRILIGDDLFIFGGSSENPNDYYFGKIHSDNIVWKLNLKTMTWYKEGVYTTSIKTDEGYFNFQNKNKMYMISRGADNKFYEIDIANNSIKKYSLPSYLNIKSCYFDEKTEELVVLHFLSTIAKSKVIRLKLNPILINPIETETFISHPYEKWYYVLTILVILSIIFYLFYKIKNKNTLLNNKSIVFDTNTKQLKFKGKHIDAFDVNESKIIIHLIQNQGDYIPLNSLNILLEQEEIIENYSSTTKRRENTLNSVVTKLSLITGCHESEIICYRKNPNDKRLKEIKLKDHFIRVK